MLYRFHQIKALKQDPKAFFSYEKSHAPEDQRMIPYLGNYITAFEFSKTQVATGDLDKL